MKIKMLFLLLLSACGPSEEFPPVYDYAVTWTCLSPEGCERTVEVTRIDRLRRVGFDCLFTSTQDESFSAEATLVISDFLPTRCSWMSFLSLFGQELPRSRFCRIAAGFEWELEIPNEDPATSSVWLVDGRDVDLL
jgi:hypothetical protein